MLVEVNTAWAVCVFLLSLRLGVLFLMTPVLSSIPVPIQFRVLFVLALASTMVSTGFGLPNTFVPSGLGALVVAAFSEVFVGLTLAFGLFAAFAVFSVAGKILDIQIGFGIGNVFDPVTNSQSPLLSSAFNLFGVMVFFAVDGHLTMMRGIAYSIEKIPPGATYAAFVPQAIVTQFGTMFVLGIALVAPIVFCLLLVEIGLAVVSRNLPQMNIFVIGIPVKVFVGLTMLTISVNYLGPVMAKTFASIFIYWQSVIG